MAGPVTIEETVELNHPREAVWPILSKTDWVNRAVGLPPVEYEIQPRTEGGSTVSARAKMYGMELAWEELPFEWSEPKFYQVRRVFRSGPLSEAVMGVRLRERDGGCTVEIFAHLTPKNAAGEFLARKIIGPKTMREMRAVVGHIGEFLAGKKDAPMPRLPVTTGNQHALEEAMRQLCEDGQPERLVNQLGEFLSKAPDVELSHIRPFTMARLWSEERWQVLGLFLHATRMGLVNMRWEVLCPNCRSTRALRVTSLRQVSQMAHCDVCNIRFDAEFDKSVELKFSVHPAIRTFEEQTFCLAGPGGKPHILSQMVVDPGGQREWDLPKMERSGRVRSLQVREAAVLPPESGAEVVCGPERFELKITPGANKGATVQVVNPNAYPVQVVLEGNEWDEEILTAARATNWQEFRDLFAQEVISPTEQVTIGFQVVLFTDLRGSTAMYNNIGDARAYVLVRDHFKVLHDAVAEHHGSIVKTIGDAVMAAFSTLGEAYGAARQMHEQLPRVKPGHHGPRLQLKSALHAGPCLAVNANDRLDFFGTTVNLAARLVEHGEGDDLVLADEVYQRPETQEFLKASKLVGVPGEESFTGFTQPIKVWNVKMVRGT